MRCVRKSYRPLITTLSLAGLCAAAAIDQTNAGGFYAPYQSGRAVGTALAGATARSDDASFFFFNPASIAGLPGTTITVGAQLFAPSFDIETSSATSPLGTSLTAAGDSGGLTDLKGAPSLFAAIRLNRDLWLGLGATGHFAVDIETDPNWAGRFQLLKTKIQGYNFSSALAYKPAPWLTIAGGIQVQRATAEFEKSELIPVPFAGFAEARGYLEGTDWATGFVAGLMLEPVKGSRLGISYRSRLTHTMKGTAGATLTGATIPSETAKFDMKLPEIVSVGLEHRLNARWRLFAEAQWMGWSRFDGFDIAFGSGRPNEVRAQQWDDTWLFALGAGVHLTPNGELTFGAHYDQAVSDGGKNTLSPDGDRTMLAVGYNYRVSDNASIAFHYAHAFFKDAEIDVAQPNSGSFTGTFKGKLDIVGASFTMNW